MNLGVGWVEERNPTPEEIGIVGFHFVTPNLLSLAINHFQVSPTLREATLRASTWTIFCPQPRMKIILSLWAGKPRPYSFTPSLLHSLFSS